MTCMIAWLWATEEGIGGCGCKLHINQNRSGCLGRDLQIRGMGRGWGRGWGAGKRVLPCVTRSLPVRCCHV